MASILDGLTPDDTTPAPSILDGLGTPKPSAARRLLADPAISLAKGVIGAGEGIVGLGDIVSGGAVGRGVDYAANALTGYTSKTAKESLQGLKTPEQQAADLAVQQADGFVPTVKAALQNPSTIPHAIIESAPSMLAGGALARGVGAVSKLGAIARAGIGEGAISGGQTAEQIRQESPGGIVSPGQAALAAGSGALTGLIAGGSGALARKLGITDIDTALAGGGRGVVKPGVKPPGMVRRGAEGFFTEGVLEELTQSAQEQAAQNLALGKPIGEGVGNAAAIGMLTGGVQGGLTAAAFPGRAPAVPQPVPQPVPETADQQFERAYGVPPGGLTDAELSQLRQEQAQRDLEAGLNPPKPAPFDAAAQFEGLVGPDDTGTPPPPAAPVPDPLHKPDAGPLSRAAGIAVDTGLAPNPFMPTTTEAFVPRTEVTAPPDLQMQNRDRSRPGSIAQMNAIANNPDYDRLGVGRSPNEAAPMVSVGANAPAIPETDFGHASRVVMGDGSKIAVRYAVVEAPTVLASHNVDGSVNGDYFASVPPGTIRALNNGRVAALQAAHARGTTQGYVQSMLADAAAHGIAPEAITSKKNPILVRVYDDAENARPNMGAISNPQLSLKPSAPETAQNDARFLEVAGLKTDDTGELMNPENAGVLKAFLAQIPQSEQNELVTDKGYTKQFADRVRAAVFAKAYGNADIVSQAVEDTDPDTKNVLHALTAAAPEFAKVEHGARLDVRPAIVEAISILRSARSRGMKASDLAAHPDLLGRDPMTQAMTDFMVQNARSPKRMAAGFAEAARFLQAEQAAATTADMFGRPPATVADLAARVNAYLEKTFGPETTLIAAEKAAPFVAGKQPGAAAGSRAAVASDGDGRQPGGRNRAGAAPGIVSEPPQDLIAIVPDVQGLPPQAPETAAITRADQRATTIPAELQLAIDQMSQSAELAKLDAAQRPVLLDHYRKAAQAKAGYDALVTKIAAATNGRPMLADLKGIKRATEKIQADYAGDASKIKDVLRGTVAVRTVEDAQAAVAQILEAFDVQPKGRRNLFAEGQPDPEDGYRDAKFNISLNGITAEIQVGIEEMLDAKENGPGHKLYEARQTLERRALDQKRDYTKDEIKAIANLNAKMRAVYGPAWTSATKARNSASSIGAPLRRAEPGSKDRGGETSKQAQAGVEPQAKATGIPSTSKNLAEAGNEAGREVSIDTPIVGETAPNYKSSIIVADQFFLTGSKRKADTNPAQMQLFDDAAQFIRKSVDALVDPKRETPKAMTARERALRDLTQAGRVNVLAASINVDMIRDGTANILGQRITGLEDLAALGQVYRDPRFETLRYIIVKDGKVIYETAVSSRLPAASAVYAGDWPSFIRGLRKTMKELDADGFYMLHNHPSGNANPSANDLELTENLNRLVPKFKGHIVIDTNEYGVITMSYGNGATAPFAEAKIIKGDFGAQEPRSLVKPAVGGYFANVLGHKVFGARDLALVGRFIRDEGGVPLIGVDSKGLVVFAGTFEREHLFRSGLRTSAMINRAARASGSGAGMFITGLDNEAFEAAKELVRKGILRDAMDKIGTSARAELDDVNMPVVPFNSLGHGKYRGKMIFAGAAEETSPYDAGDLFGDAAEVTAKTKAAVKRKAPAIAALPSSQFDLFGNPADTGSEGARNDRPGKDRPPSVRGPQPVPVPPVVGGGTTPSLLQGEGGGNAGSNLGNDQQQPGGPQGVQPGQHPVANPAGGDSQQPAGDRSGNRHGYLPGIPAGRDIPAKTGRNFSFGDADLSYAGGWLTKGQQNLAALKLLQQLEKDGRQATRDEQAVLAKYVGWGAGELANKLFGDTLDKAEESMRLFDAALESMDGGGKWAAKNVLNPREPGHYQAHELLSERNPKRSFYEPITRAQLMAAKPDGAAKSWIALRDELKDLLTEEQWADASKSTQYAHYTSKEVVRGMWAAMKRMGFRGGALIEPGSGIGVFPGLMDAELANNTAYTGIEFEPVAGGILKQLFPDERIVLGDFIKTALPRDFYDAAIGNPPFAGFPVLADPEYKKHGFLLHDYFFAKTVDRVKPGGLMVFVTSHGTMDKRNDKARQYLGERADLVGAIRLPQTAFKKNAGTEVVTDVLFLRKKVEGETFEQGQAWLDVKPAVDENGKPLVKVGAKGKEPIWINEYFHAHPEMVLGTHSTAGSMRSASEYTVLPREGDIAQHFLDAVANLPENVYQADHGTSADAAKGQQLDFDPKAKKEGGFYLSPTGTLMRVKDGVGSPFVTQSPVLKSYVPLRDALKQAQYDQLNNGPWEESLAALQKAYKRFVKAHGNIRENTPYERETTRTDEVTGEEVSQVNKYRRWKHQKDLLQDPDYWLVAALEEIDEESDKISPASPLSERVLEKPKVAEIKTAADAMLATLNETGKVNMARIAELAGITEEEAIASLQGSIYRDTSGKWQTADEYLSGDVRQKLTEAMAAAASDKRFEANVEALRTVQPREIPHQDINVRLGMSFIKPEVYEQFAREKLEINVKVSFLKATGRWIVEDQGRGEPMAGRMSGAKLLDHAMSGAPIRVERLKAGTKDQMEMDPDATAAAVARAKQMQDEFRAWLWSDEKRTAELTKDYNDTFNTIVPRQFDGRHLTLPGTSKLFNIFDHVKRGAWRIIQSGNTYLAHAVGSGKTFQMVISAMEQKRLGLIKKPMMVVPRHMLGQFAAEWQALYPTARLMVADEKSFHTDVRREFVARASLSDLDGIIITHSAFKLLDLDPAFKTKLIEQELESFRQALIEAGGDPEPKIGRNGKPIRSRDPKIKQIEAAIEKLTQKLEAAASSAGKDKQTARFDEMGVDMLYVDEAHEFRRLAYPTQRQMKGIQPGGSDQAFDLWMKTRYLEEKKPGRSLVMASGTPVTNTVAELYNVMRMMDPSSLEAKGISRFDEWAAMFGREDTKLEPDAGGEYTNVTRFSQFANLPELAQLFRKFADVLNAEDLGKLLGDKRPTVKDGSRKIVVAPMTPTLREYRKELRTRMAISRDWKPSFDEPNNPDPIIRIIGDGRLAAIDMRYVDPALLSDPKSKLNTMIDGVLRVYKEANQPGQEVERGTQMVFSDIGFGEGVTERRGFNAKAWFIKRLREGGIPANEIAFIGDYNTAQKRLTLFRQMNEGKVRVLIGGSRNLGTGTNAQRRLRALHHLDTPWFPAHVEQREGRAVRAGNTNKEVELYGYATKGSYDETMWKLVATKQRFVEQAMSGDPNLREIADVSEVGNFEQASALLADDERVLQLAGLNSEVEQLTRLYNSHNDDVGRARREVAMARSQIERLEDRDIPAADKLAGKVQDLSADKFTAKIGDTTYTKRKEFGEAINAAAKALAVGIKEGAEQIGEISGFPIMFSGRIVKDFNNTKVVGYDTLIWMRVGDEKQVFSHSFNDDPLGLAMRVGNQVAAVAAAPKQMRAYLGELKSRVHALTPKIDAKFPMLQELLDKAAEARALEDDIQANPYVDPADLAATPEQEQDAGLVDDAGRWLGDGGRLLPLEEPPAPYAAAPIFGYDPRQGTPEVRDAEARQANPEPPKDAPEWVKKMAPEMREALRKSGVWVQKKSIKERAREFMQDAGLKILQGTIDQFAPVLKRLGDYPYKLLRMASAYDAGLEASLFSGRLRVNTAGALEVMKDTHGLVEILKPLNGEVDRFLSWVAGNRAETLKAEDREHLFGDTDIAQLKSLNRKLHDADNFPNGDPGDQRAVVYARVLRDYNEFSKSVLDIAEKAGIVSAEGRQVWERNFYVPFYREQEEGGGTIGNVSGMVNQYAFKKLKGGTGVLHDLLANSVQNWSHLLQASLKNNAAKVTLERAKELGAARLAQRVGEGKWEKGSVFVLDKGKEVHYIVEDQLILDAISSLEATPFRGPAMKFFGTFKHWLTFGATVSPSFRLRNMFRDTVQSLASGQGTYNPMKVWLQGFKYSSRNNPEYYNMLAGGGIFRMGSHLEGNRAAYIKRLVANGIDATNLVDSEAKAKQVLGKAWDWWQETGERSEAISRANRYKETYDALIAAGTGHDRAHFEASYAARDIMDFSLHGRWAAIRMLTQMVPFMNARLQGLYKLGRAAQEDPRRFAAVIGGVTLASIALMLAYRGDPDWEEREEWDRDNNWWFKVGGVGFRIPKPFEVGAMATVAERALEVVLNGMDPASRERFINRLWPLVASQLAMNPIPQALSPAIQLWANKNAFTGRPIESQRTEHLPTSQRIGANTSATAQLLGKAGILSPEQIDFTINAYFAWIGAHAVATADLAVRPAMGLPDRPARRLDNYFVVGDFAKELPAAQSRFVTQFYEHLAKTQEAMGELRNAQQLGQLERVAELVREGDVNLRMAPVYAKVQREMGQIQARIRQVQAKDMPADAKREEIDRLNAMRNRMAAAVEDVRARAPR